MRRREERAIEKHTVNFYVGEYQKLQVIFGSRIGAGKVVRDLVSLLIKKIESRVEQKMNTPVPLVSELDISLDIRKKPEAENEH